ncbi:hypothetical protein LT85_4212 [Collimonas arenae]|uniref:DUF4359 domain-containing protein n=1 Tax=Collimonas arenae TaxID=279058 RepID=A0A0A1FI41_9BURK|nr:DUF4359 domain-containing protein [Collimonas arenae]AIY43370.1 hypothetical protein LT85_4212 [Collimonas arenae]
MKPTSAIVIASILGVLIFTNPKIDNYEQYIHQAITQETSHRDGLTQAIGTLFGGVASSFIANSTVRNNYVLFSIYDSDLGNQHLKYVGILGNFFQLAGPKKDQ